MNSHICKCIYESTATPFPDGGILVILTYRIVNICKKKAFRILKHLKENIVNCLGVVALGLQHRAFKHNLHSIVMARHLEPF